MRMSKASERRSSSRVQDLTIRAGRSSMSTDLGAYYLEAPGVVSLVESGFHGPLDGAGIPLTDIGGGEHVYSPIVIAQYALALHDEHRRLGSRSLEKKFSAQIEAIVAHVEHQGEWRGFFIHR